MASKPKVAEAESAAEQDNAEAEPAKAGLLKKFS